MYRVYEDNNFYFPFNCRGSRGDEAPGRKMVGINETYDKALAVCRYRVKKWLRETVEQVLGPDEWNEDLYEYYLEFGPDPFIISTMIPPGEGFHAWDYARELCNVPKDRKPTRRRIDRKTLHEQTVEFAEKLPGLVNKILKEKGV